MSQLREASTPRPIDPALPIDMERGHDWWCEASSSGLVEAGVAALVRWLERDR